MVGIYKLIRENVIVYIGQSIYLEDRIRTHKREGVKEFDDVQTIFCDKEDLDRLEKELIEKYCPEYNKCLNPEWLKSMATGPLKTLKVSAEIWKRLKMLAVERETTIGKLIEELLNEYTK